jgi:ACT domain-containing protein
MNEKLFIVFGTGTDAVGLVQKITTPIAGINANIIDLRQDVLHGLFTVFLVLDLAHADRSPEEVRALVDEISKNTGLDLVMDEYQPVPRAAEKRNLLLILLGRDKPGIVATVSGILSTYQINVEFSQMIARENIFLMELMVDIGRCVLPLENLQNVLRERMGALGIDTLFQDRDVFNKKKRILLFALEGSFMDASTRREILRQVGILPEEFAAVYPPGNGAKLLATVATHLDGMPVAVMEQLMEAVEVTPGTMELIQTLKTMGYKVAVTCNALGLFSEAICRRLGIDACFGLPAPVNEDAMTFVGELPGEEGEAPKLERVIEQLVETQGVSRRDITVISDRVPGESAPPGIHIRFDMKLFLDFFNQHVLSRESLIGVLGSFGAPVES